MSEENRDKLRTGISRLAVNALTLQLNNDRMRSEVKTGLANISNDNREQAERITAALRLAGYIDENVSAMPANMIEAFFNTMNSLDDELVKQGVADLFKERINSGVVIYPDAFIEKYFLFVRNACNEKSQMRVINGFERGMKKYRQRTFGAETLAVVTKWSEEATDADMRDALDALLTAHKINKREKNSLNSVGSVSLTKV